MFSLLNASVDTDITIQTDAPVTTTEVVDLGGELIAPEVPLSDKIGPFILPVLMIAFVWFIMIRPENKRRKEVTKFREGLKKGDKVITAGGIHATVKEIKETTLLIEVDSNVTLRIEKSFVSADPAAAQPSK
ncbi:MAG: preprotein translocase subunit YajC [Rikenellaceae bacterium]